MQFLPLLLFFSPFLLIALLVFAKARKEARFMALLEHSGITTPGTVIEVRKGTVSSGLTAGHSAFSATVMYEDQGKIYMHKQQTSQTLSEGQYVRVSYLPQQPAYARLVDYSPIQRRDRRKAGYILFFVFFFCLVYWFIVRLP